MEFQHPSWFTIEELRPLTDEHDSLDDLDSCGYDFESLTRSEKAGKLLDHLDRNSNDEGTDLNDCELFTDDNLEKFMPFDDDFFDNIQESDFIGTEIPFDSKPVLDEIFSSSNDPVPLEFNDVSTLSVSPVPETKFFPPDDFMYYEKLPSPSPVAGSEDSDYEPPTKITKTTRTKRAYTKIKGQTPPKVKSASRSSRKDIDRTYRKRMQNKDAAYRYRMKKKAEVQSWVDEEGNNLARNNELKEKIREMSSEIRHLKSILRDLFRKRGMIN